MSNIKKFNCVFAEVFGVDVSSLNDSFSKETVDNWDSVRQLTLVTALEDEFDIMMETEEIIAVSSYAKAREIILKYNVDL